MTVVFTPAAKRGGSRVNFPESGGHPGEARLSEVRSSRGLLKRLLEGIFCEPRLYRDAILCLDPERSGWVKYANSGFQEK